MRYGIAPAASVRTMTRRSGPGKRDVAALARSVCRIAAAQAASGGMRSTQPGRISSGFFTGGVFALTISVYFAP